MKLLNQNLQENKQAFPSGGKANSRKAKKASPASDQALTSNITARSLDWEQDEVTSSLTGSENKASFDAVITCDCIYNDALIDPLVQTCADICKLRELDTQAPKDMPTLCIVAQQLRSDEVFEAWLKAFHNKFKVWRVPDEELTKELGTDSGYVVHVGILR